MTSLQRRVKALRPVIGTLETIHNDSPILSTVAMVSLDDNGYHGDTLELYGFGRYYLHALQDWLFKHPGESRLYLDSNLGYYLTREQVEHFTNQDQKLP